MARGRLKFDDERCKACELCVFYCPQGILELDKHQINSLGFHPVTITQEEKCNGCAICAMMCPDMIIQVERE